MKVAVASMWYPISISRYFLKALQHMPDIEVVTVGPTSGSSIPWPGEFDFPDAALFPDFETGFNPQSAGEVVRIWQSDYFDDVDVWIDIDAGFFIDADLGSLPHIGICTDPHALDYSRQREVWDVTFCMQKVYAKPDDVYLPYAYSEFDHYPEYAKETYDVTVLGLQYTDRVLVAETLSSMGLSVYRRLGDIWDDYRRSICSAPICFTWSSKQDLIARVFEGLAMKRLVVTNRVPDLRRFFREDMDLVAFSTHQEAVEKVLHYQDNPADALEIAERGFNQVQGHTYTTRLHEVFEYIGASL